MPVDETGVFNESPTTLQANNPMIHDTANFEQDLEISIPSLSTAVQDKNPVTDATNSAKDVTGTSIASLITLASNELSKSAILERLLEDTNLDSDVASKINYNKCFIYKHYYFCLFRYVVPYM